MDTTNIIAVISAAIAFGSLVFTLWANRENKRIAEAALSQTKKAGATDLVAAWKGVRNIDPKNPITPQVDNALTALQLTAGYWLHDIVEREIIHQLTWRDYQSIYDALKDCDVPLPGTKATGKSILTPEIGDVYAQMNIYKRSES